MSGRDGVYSTGEYLEKGVEQIVEHTVAKGQPR